MDSYFIARDARISVEQSNGLKVRREARKRVIQSLEQCLAFALAASRDDGHGIETRMESPVELAVRHHLRVFLLHPLYDNKRLHGREIRGGTKHFSQESESLFVRGDSNELVFSVSNELDGSKKEE